MGWASLLKPYAGYLLFVSRSIACLARGIPWEYVPTFYVIASSLVVALIGRRLACAQLPLLERVLAAIALVAVPHSGEVFLNVTNLHWFLGVLLVVNLLEEPPERAVGAWHRSVELLVAGLSGPVVIVLVPFAAVWSWCWHKNRLSWPLIGAWLICACVQTVTLILSERAVGDKFSVIVGELHWVVPRYAAALFVGHWHPYDLAVGWMALLGGVMALGMSFWDRTNRRRHLGFLLLVAAVFLLVAGRASGKYWPHPTANGARYAYLPFVLVMWALASFAVGTCRRTHRIPALALYGLMICSAASAWKTPALPGSDWSTQVREAKTGRRVQFEVAPGMKFPVPAGIVPRP